MTKGCIARAAILTSILVLSGCYWNEHWYRGAKHLDYVAKLVDEYGTVSISEPLVIENKGQFAIDVNRPVKEYVDAARAGSQGAARQSIEMVRDTQTAVQSDLDVEQLAATALTVAATSAAPGSGAVLQVAEQALSAASGAGPATDEAEAAGEVTQAEPGFESKVPLDRPAKAALASEKMSAPLALGALPAAISERQALLVGVNDKVTENVLKYLVNPGVGVGGNKKVYLGVLQVSVQPGWHTRTGHVAEVHVSQAYACPRPTDAEAVDLSDCRGKPRGQAWCSSRSVDNTFPMVFSAFPSIEAQTLDLRYSARQQVAEATFWAQILRASGGVVQAEQLDDYVERLERDIATRNPVPIVTSYSNGNGFGYQIRPSLHALADAADEESEAGNVLQPASFPAVIMIVAEGHEIEKWSDLEWSISSRWIPTEKPCCWDRLTEKRRLRASHELDKALSALVVAYRDPLGPGADSNTLQELRRRYVLYSSVGQGVTRYSRIPLGEKDKAASCLPAKATPVPSPTPVPAIVSINPLEGWQNAPSVFAIKGIGFSKGNDSIVKQVLVGGVAATFVAVGKDTLVAVVPAGSFDPDPPGAGYYFDQEVTVVTTQEVLRSPPGMGVTFDKRAAQRPDTENPSVKLVRNAQGRVVEIVLDGSAHLAPAALLGAIKDVLTNEQSILDNVKVSVTSSSSIDREGKPDATPTPHN